MKRVGEKFLIGFLAAFIVSSVMAMAADARTEPEPVARAFMSERDMQVIMVMEIDAGSLMNAEFGYQYLSDEDALEVEYDVTLYDTDRLSRREKREYGVDNGVIYEVEDADGAYGLMMFAQADNYVYIFALRVPDDSFEMDLDAFDELVIETIEVGVEEVEAPIGYEEVYLDDTSSL